MYEAYEYLIEKVVDWFFSLFEKKSIPKISIKYLVRKKKVLPSVSSSLGFSSLYKKHRYASNLNKSKHTLIAGSSGFGKTYLMYLLMRGDLKEEKAVIFIDPKGDMKTQRFFQGLCSEQGKRAVIISSNNSKTSSCDSLNFFKSGTADQIADRIHSSFEWSEQYYSGIALRALRDGIINLKSITSKIDFPSLLQEIKELSKTSEYSKKDLESLISKLSNIANSDLNSLSNANGKSIEEYWRDGDCVYISLPVLGFPVAARALGKLLLNEINYAVYRNYEHPLQGDVCKFSLYIDELGSFITNEFVELLNKCRGARVELNMAFQSPSDIKKVDPELLDQLFENTNNWFIMKQRVDEYTNYLSKAIGTRSSIKKTEQVKDGRSTGSYSERAVEELIVHPNVIKNLAVGQCILLEQDPNRVDVLNLTPIEAPKYIAPPKQDLDKYGYSERMF